MTRRVFSVPINWSHRHHHHANFNFTILNINLNLFSRCVVPIIFSVPINSSHHDHICPTPPQKPLQNPQLCKKYNLEERWPQWKWAKLLNRPMANGNGSRQMNWTFRNSESSQWGSKTRRTIGTWNSRLSMKRGIWSWPQTTVTFTYSILRFSPPTICQNTKQSFGWSPRSLGIVGRSCPSKNSRPQRAQPEVWATKEL